MVKRLLLALVVGAVLFMGAGAASIAEVKNPDTLIVADIGTVDSFDPAWAYDIASNARIFNIYETLIAFQGEKTDAFSPVLANKVPTVENGLIAPDGLSYAFPVRKGVPFANGEILTPEDVEYSFERAMVQDRDGGPVWMLYEALIGTNGSRDRYGTVVVDFSDIDSAIQVEGDNVVFHLKEPYPPFLSMVASTLGSIVNKKFCVDNGDWPGTAETWEEYNNPEPGTAALQKIACGTGPFNLERWEPGVETVLIRFDDYWRDPAQLKRVVWKNVEEWTTRKLMFLAGDVDIVYVPPAYDQELEGIEGVNVVKNLPDLALTLGFFNFEINPEANNNIGSGTLDGNGIPPDFFSSKDIRLGFAHCFDWETYLRDVFQNEALQPFGPIPEKIAYVDTNQKIFNFDPEKAEMHFKRAWNGEVWEKGFKFSLLYNQGNTQREIAAMMFAEKLAALNPKFQVEVRALDWREYLAEIFTQKLAFFIINWQSDYPDPHSFVYPLMHSQGVVTFFQSYYNPIANELIERAVKIVHPEKRRPFYYELQWIYHEDVVGIPLFQESLRHYARDWVQGWYYNPIYPGANIQGYLYPIYKK